jgi:hypothetical protein
MSLALARQINAPEVVPRGDPIEGRRYYCRDFVQREWDQMWTRVWHVGGCVNELEQAGDYLVHNFRTLTGTPEGVHFFRTEPHRDDPEKCTFDYWFLAPRVEGMHELMTACGMRPLEEAEHESFEYTEGASVEDNILGSFVEQDLSVAVNQQLGFHSRGYTDAVLSGQESRVRRFHEVLNDYLQGRR